VAADVRALILTVEIDAAWLLPATADHRCRYSAKPIPVLAISEITDVTGYRDTPEHARAWQTITEALSGDRASGVQATQRQILRSRPCLDAVRPC
jgi:hypothetical protein